MHPGQTPLPNARQERFCKEYILDRNGTQAYIRAGYASRSARVEASKALTKPDIRARIAVLEQDHLGRVRMTAQDIIQRYTAIALADPSELVELRVGACRHCHGDGHRYQWRTQEERETAAPSDQPPGDMGDAGGYGYRRSLDPHPDCPYCDGDGEPFVVFADTRTLSPSAKSLLKGVKHSAHGFQIQMHDQLAALEALARLTGPHRTSEDPETALAEFVASLQGSSAPIADETEMDPGA